MSDLMQTIGKMGGLSAFPVKDVAGAMFKPFGLVKYLAKESPIATIAGGGSDESAAAPASPTAAPPAAAEQPSRRPHAPRRPMPRRKRVLPDDDEPDAAIKELSRYG
jgi:hypothetical protein